MLDGLDDELAGLGFTAFDIQLPGRDAAVAPLEGSLRLDRLDDGFALRTVDYGQAHTLGVARTEAEARELVLGYLSRSLPPVVALSRDRLDELAAAVAPHFFDVRDRATEAGPAGIVIDLSPGRRHPFRVAAAGHRNPRPRFYRRAHARPRRLERVRDVNRAHCQGWAKPRSRSSPFP